MNNIAQGHGPKALMKGYGDRCSACGNADDERIYAMTREYEPPGALGLPARARLWWWCAVCNHTWKQVGR